MLDKRRKAFFLVLSSPQVKPLAQRYTCLSLGNIHGSIGQRFFLLLPFFLGYLSFYSYLLSSFFAKNILCNMQTFRIATRPLCELNARYSLPPNLTRSNIGKSSYCHIALPTFNDTQTQPLQVFWISFQWNLRLIFKAEIMLSLSTNGNFRNQHVLCKSFPPE